MGIFDRPRATAKRLIDKKGEQVTWNRETNIANPSKPWEPAETTDSTSKPTMVFLPDDRDQRETKHRSRRSSVIKGSTMAFATGLGFVPSLKDTIYRASLDKTYRIETIEALKPNAEETIIYELRLA